MELNQFVNELKTRGVYRTAVAYCAGAWVLLQVADVIFPTLGLPEWAITMVLVIVACGFPIAILLSWIYDLTAKEPVETPSRPVGAASHLPIAHVIELTIILILAGLVGYLYFGRLVENPEYRVQGELQPASIAVLPFVNMSDMANREYVGDGLAEEILNLLAKLTELNVAARTSSFYFKDKDADIPMIGRQLGVEHVLEGSVRYDGDRVRVTAQLIKTQDGFHVWSETYDRDRVDIFSLQDEIAREVVKSLQILLSDDSRNLLARDSKTDAEAYDYYLRARAYMRLPREEDNLRFANELFEKAAATAPDFADAHAGLCESWAGLYEIGLDMENFRRAEKACQRALLLDRRAASVYLALGQLYLISGQYARAIEEFSVALSLGTQGAEAYLGLGETYYANGKLELAEESYLAAVELQPNYWRAHLQMGNFLLETWRVEEAITYYKRVSELMPDSSVAISNLGVANFMIGNFEAASQAWRRSIELAPSALAYSNMGTSLFMQGRFDEAIPIYHQAVERTPDDYEAWGNLGDAYKFSSTRKEMAGPMYENAIKLAKRRLEINANDTDTLAQIGHYYAGLGNREQAETYLSRAAQANTESMYVHYFTATAYAELGDREKALQALKQALAAGVPRHLVAADENLRNLRDMLEFKSLLAQKE